MHENYRSPFVRWLRDRQQAEASRDDVLTQIEAAEGLIASLDSDQRYQVGEVLPRITNEPLPDDSLAPFWQAQDRRQRPGT